MVRQLAYKVSTAKSREYRASYISSVRSQLFTYHRHNFKNVVGTCSYGDETTTDMNLIFSGLVTCLVDIAVVNTTVGRGLANFEAFIRYCRPRA